MKEYIRDLIHFSPGVRWFVLTEALLGTGIGIFTLLLNLHLLALGFDEKQVGAVTSAGTLVMAAVSIPGGLLASRFGRKKILTLGLVLVAAGYASFGAGTELWIMYGAQWMQSAGLSLLITTEVQLIYSYSKSKKEETQGFSMLFALFTLFMGVGTLAGGYLPEWLGGRTTVYQWTLLTAGGFIMTGAIARYVLLPGEPASRVSEETRRGTSSVRGRIRLPGKAVWLFCGINVLVGIAAAFLDPFLNVIVKFRMGWSDEGTSLLLTLNGIVLFVCSFIMPPLLERLGISTTYRLVFVLNLLAAGGLALVLPSGIFSLLLLARGGAFIMVNNLVLTHTMSAVPERDRNTYAGLRLVLRSLGMSAAAYGAGVLLSGKHYGLPFLWAGLFLAAAFVYFERLVKPLILEDMKRKEEA